MCRFLLTMIAGVAGITAGVVGVGGVGGGMGVGGQAHAGQIDLSTVPRREAVQLTIYNTEDLTLVRDRRTITVREGENNFQFAWANTLIDPTSVQLQFRSHEDELHILDTRYPHDRDEVLYWTVESEHSGAVEVEITYFTSNISWAADYELIADEDEAAADLHGYVTVKNHSGEDYANAQIRLVVGEINLVQTVRELAERGVIDRRYMDLDDGAVIPEQVQRRALQMQMAREGLAADVAAPPEVAKEELGEYFIFMIEGEQTVPHGWSRRMRSFEPVRPELDVEYRFHPQRFGDRLVRMYRFDNDEASGLGEAPLPDGTVRIFRRAGDRSVGYEGRQDIRYIPIGDQVELNLGRDGQVTLEQKTYRVFRRNITYSDDRDRVVGWDTHRVMAEVVHNTRDEPVEVQIRRPFDGDVTFRSQLDVERFDVNTVEMTVTVEPHEKLELRYETITREGRNQRQRRVEISVGAPATVPWMQ